MHLNITLIYLPPYSPHLNPIEQIWRQMKREIKHYYLESKEFYMN
ncbi:MAG: transposase [Methanobrevibacter sp.]|nr:transposase [Methanobrevibacter sp.]